MFSRQRIAMQNCSDQGKTWWKSSLCSCLDIQRWDFDSNGWFVFYLRHFNLNWEQFLSFKFQCELSFRAVEENFGSCMQFLGGLKSGTWWLVKTKSFEMKIYLILWKKTGNKSWFLWYVEVFAWNIIWRVGCRFFRKSSSVETCRKWWCVGSVLFPPFQV